MLPKKNKQKGKTRSFYLSNDAIDTLDKIKNRLSKSLGFEMSFSEVLDTLIKHSSGMKLEDIKG